MQKTCSRHWYPTVCYAPMKYLSFEAYYWNVLLFPTFPAPAPCNPHFRFSWFIWKLVIFAEMLAFLQWNKSKGHTRNSMCSLQCGMCRLPVLIFRRKQESKKGAAGDHSLFFASPPRLETVIFLIYGYLSLCLDSCISKKCDFGGRRENF